MRPFDDSASLEAPMSADVPRLCKHADREADGFLGSSVEVPLLVKARPCPIRLQLEPQWKQQRLDTWGQASNPATPLLCPPADRKCPMWNR